MTAFFSVVTLLADARAATCLPAELSLRERDAGLLAYDFVMLDARADRSISVRQSYAGGIVEVTVDDALSACFNVTAYELRLQDRCRCGGKIGIVAAARKYNRPRIPVLPGCRRFFCLWNGEGQALIEMWMPTTMRRPIAIFLYTIAVASCSLWPGDGPTASRNLF